MIDLLTIYRLGWGSANREDSGEVCHLCKQEVSEVVRVCVLGKMITISTLTRALVFFNLYDTNRLAVKVCSPYLGYFF